MARWAAVAVAGLLAFGIYSSVYACDGARKAKVVRQALEAPQAITFAVETRGENVRRIVYVTPRCEATGPASTMMRTARMARTLGRALVTTVEAVMGTLVHAAVEKTASVV